MNVFGGLSEISQTEKDTVWYHLYVESKKKCNKLVNKPKKKQVHIYMEKKLMVTCRERGVGGAAYGVGGQRVLLCDYMKSCVWNFWKL